MNKRKGVSTKTSPHDQSVIKYIFYNYDPEEIESLKFTFKIGLTYLKDAKAGEFLLKISQNSNNYSNFEQDQKPRIELKNNIIRFFDTGSVDSISSNLQKITYQNQEYYTVKKSIPKKPILELFQMRLCQHIPSESKVKQLIEEQMKVQDKRKSKNRKVQKANAIYCKKCEERLYYFYLEEEKIVTFGDLERQIEVEDLDEDITLEWSVMLGEKFTKSTEIARLNDKQFFLKENGKISYLIDWPFPQNLQKSTQVLRYRPIYCQHQKIQLNTCQYCFQQVDPMELNFKKYLFQMQEKDDFKRQMITTGSTLVEQENKFVDDLLERQRGILVLDLDNTVLHSIQLGQIHKSRLEEIQEYYHLIIGGIAFNRYVIKSQFVVKMRPYFKDFIQTAINFYQVYVYTKGTRSYAEQICNAIRNQYASKDYPSNNKNEKIEYFQFLKDKNAFTPNKIITRDEDPDLEKKSLSNILPTRQENLMVMDDLASVWGYSSAVLNTVPFHFFFKKKIIESQKLNNGNGTLQRRFQHKALDESKEGQKLDAVQDLHAQTLQPVRQLPCDHFQREVEEIQSGLIHPQQAIDLPCGILQRQVHEISSREFFITTQTNEKGEIQEQIKAVQSVSIHSVQPQLIEITQGTAPEDKEYDYDILPRADYYLVYAAHNLIVIHKQFFSTKKSLKPNEKKLSFGQLNRKLRFDLLSGTSIKFCLKNQTKIDIYWRSIKLGCKIISSDSQTTPQYIIRLNNLKSNISRMYYKKQEEQEKSEIIKQESQIQKETIKQLKFYSQTLKIPIVSESWIEFCYSFTYQFPVQPFIIDSDRVFQEIQEQEFEWVIEDHALQLLKQIRQRNSQFEKSRSNSSQKL